MKVWHLLIASTLAALVGAGIVLGVLALWEPWEDASGSVSQADIDHLSEEIADLSGASQAEADALKCAAALEAAPTANLRGSLSGLAADLQDIINEFC